MTGRPQPLAGPATTAPPDPARASSVVSRLLGRPPIGWTSVLLLFLMLVTAGLAMDVPRLAGVSPGGGSQTAFLAWVTVLSGATGLVIARTRLPTILAHLAGAIVGVGVLLVSWAGAISDATSLQARLSDINQAAATLFDDVVLKRGRTEETIGFLIVIGAIAWTTGQFSAFNLVKRGVVAPAVVSIGTLMLVIALAPAVNPETIYVHLVVLTGLSLLLMLRANLAHQEASWRRRHIAGGLGVERPFLRGGALVCAIALAGATVLAANVVASPLKDAFESVDQRLLDLATAIDSLFGGVGEGTRAATGSYTDTAPISDTWSTEDTTMFTWTSPADRLEYWRGAAYSRFTGGAWTRDRLAETSTFVPAGHGLLDGSVDSVSGDTAGTRDVPFALTNQGLDGRTLLAPATPLSVDRDADVRLDGRGGPFFQIDLPQRLGLGETVLIEARLAVTGRDGLTESKLAAAGYDYGAQWPEEYTRIIPGTLPDSAVLLAERIADEVPERSSPYDVARRMELFFTDQGPLYRNDEYDFRYDTDLTDDCKPGQGVVDCLLDSKRGFCQQYATAMTLMLRSQAIPARYVQGFLPGERMADGGFSVPMAAAHAWVEVYFPGYGWVRFDPTPGGDDLEELGQSTSDLPRGEPVPTPTPLDPSQPDPTPVFSDPPSPSPDPALFTPPPDDPPAQGFLGLDLPWPLVFLLALAIALLVALIVAARRLRSVPGRDPDLLYRAVAALAARAGHGPRPDQTPYEFTATLTEAVPSAGPDLQAVARAKVETTYARRAPEGDALDELIESFRRVKRALVGLVLRGRRRG